MSDHLNHECGIAMVRLKKPLQYYYDTYGTSLYGLQKLFLLLEKQHNRGQDGVGIGCCKLGMEHGQPYMFRSRSAEKDSLSLLFSEQTDRFYELTRRGRVDPADSESVKAGFDYGGEILMGHLRYGTSGDFGTGACHPYVRRTNWPTRTLMVMGNFNMTNTSELNERLIKRGQHPVFDTDTQTVLEEIGFHMDQAHTKIYRNLRGDDVDKGEIASHISEDLDMSRILKKSAKVWDGGYTIAGAVGNGDSFVMRDPHGIRPCFYFENDEMCAFASERVPLMTVFGLDQDDIHELEPGHIAVVKNTGDMSISPFFKKLPEPKKCSFERIYFSRGNDPDIYQERKALGAALVPQVIDFINNDIENTVVSFVPNTAEIAYYGLLEGLRLHRREEVRASLVKAQADGTLDEKMIDSLIMGNWPRGEKIAHKDIKMRTFISQEDGRAQLVSHVYDITYGVVRPKDSLVVVDDSIVRGTTIKESILRILSRTNPKKIAIVSTAPQIRYPDCYGIDMAEIGKFIAFEAAVTLLRETGRESLLDEVAANCRLELEKPVAEMKNCVQAIYEPFSPEEISAKITELVSPKDLDWDGKIQIIYLGIRALHAALPNHSGDWYFTGDYPTPGGYRVVNKAYLHFYEKKDGRGYE